MGALRGHRLDPAGRAIAAARFERFALPALLGLAAVNFLLGLGSSSYYVDEVLSVSASDHPLGQSLAYIAHSEISPPGWFWLLHEVGAHVGSSRHEWLMRLPAAACAIGLVAAVYWLVRVLGTGRGPALVAAAICALSPFELEYAQRAQGYAAVGLAVALAGAAAIAADRAAAPRRDRLLAVSLLAAVTGLLCSYTAVLIIAPLCLWLLTRSAIPRRWGWGYAGACVAVGAALVPLLITQHSAHPERGVGTSARLTGSTLQTMLALPFGGRVEPVRLLAVLATLAGLATAVLAASRRSGTHGVDARRLVLGLAIGEPALLILLSAVGGHFWGLLMLNRYGAVAVPFIVAGLALGLAALPRAGAAGLGALVAGLLLAGAADNHRRASFYLDARGAAAHVRALPADAVLEPPYPWYEIPLDYYGLAATHPLPDTPPVLAAILRRHTNRIWLLSALPPGAPVDAATLLAVARASVARYGYRPAAARVFPSIAPLGSVLLVPDARR